MPFAEIRKWAQCPECGSDMKFDGYRENGLKCTGFDCEFEEGDSWHSYLDLLQCPDPECRSEFVEIKGGGYRENGVQCRTCGLEEGDMY